jgi:hypothetical protein
LVYLGVGQEGVNGQAYLFPAKTSGFPAFSDYLVVESGHDGLIH